MFLNISPTVVYHNRSSGGGNESATAATTPTTSSSATAASAGGASQPSSAAPSSSSFSLIFDENPLADYVELPPDARQGGLWWSNVLAGVVRGALEMVQMQTTATFVSDVLRGDEQTELRVRLVRYLDEEAPPADD